jgi:molecular chaperone GrpE (heat shock protein)
MNKKLLTGSILLMIAGIAGLAGVWTYRHTAAQRAEQYKASSTDRSKEYLRLYDEWRNSTTGGKEGYEPGNLASAPPQLPQQTPEEQAARLKANLPQIARHGLKEPAAIADMLYGQGWEHKVKKYKDLQEILDIVSAAGTVTVMLGTIFMSSCLLKLCISVIAAKLKRTDPVEDYTQLPDDRSELTELTDDETQTALETHKNAESGTDDEKLDYFHTISNQKSLLGADDLHNAISPDRTVPEPLQQTSQSAREKNEPQLTKLYSTEPVTASGNEPAAADKNLTELTQEVSAIRQFASQQQDRVRQLQDGYDWTIIKRFCIRIIRCIDNLDSRIRNLSDQGTETGYLQDVRDELVFAIESSGVEQIQIQTGSVYKGNEKIAEAVAEKEHTDDPELAGKVARVVRPGYQYAINDQQVRVVRSAQVVLYE